MISYLLLNAFVSRANLGRLMRVLKLLRSRIEVQARSVSGWLKTGTSSTEAASAGE